MKESVIRPRSPAVVTAHSGSALPTVLDLAIHFEGLANPTRLKIVERLAATTEARVSELAELCKVSQPRMSWHLRILRRAMVISTRREGREVFCRLDREALAGHLRAFVRLLSSPSAEPAEMPSVQQLLSEVTP